MAFVPVAADPRLSRLQRPLCRRTNYVVCQAESDVLARRSFLRIAALSCLGPVTEAGGAAANDGEPVITDRVFFDVSVNGKGIGRLVFALFGRDAPQTVAEFLRMVPTSTGLPPEELMPSYEGSLFFRCVPGEILELGRIRNLSTLTINDQVYYDYDGSIFSAKPELEENSLRPSQRGLLTKQKFHIGPEFSITLDGNAPSSARNTVFGRLESGFDTLEEIERLPVRTLRSMEPEGSLADNVFRAQKEFMTSFGQNVLRDQRAIDAYPFKILRRVETVRCGTLPN